MRESWYDTAQICEHGHVVNAAALSYPEMNCAFCDRCGARTHMYCRSCHAPIRGEYHVSGLLVLSTFSVPSYCPGCGEPYPWTLEKIAAAQELAAATKRLSHEERALLKESIEELAQDTPHSPLAALRFKQLATKAGADLAEALREILIDVVSEAARKAIWG